MATVQTELQLDPDLRYAVWCYVPDDSNAGWNPPHVCEYCATAADAHHYARYLRRTFHGHLFGALPTGKTPCVTR
jgi:hypothetical protein